MKAIIKVIKPLKDELKMQRCFDLARLGMGKVSPNPIVGSIISIPNKIIGEGCHKAYGKSHAEVNAVRSLSKKNLKKIKESTISVSLEPCNFTGKTPPCTNLIIDNQIPNVNISTIDRTSQVNSSGVARLKKAGIIVKTGILERKGKFVARVRNTFTTRKRPYIILKFAQCLNSYMGLEDKQVWLTNSYTKRMVHKWRAEVAAIMVGTGTALTDNPQLNNRHYPGQAPLRITIDKKNKLPDTIHLKDKRYPTWIYTKQIDSQDQGNLKFKEIEDTKDILNQICDDLYKANQSTLLVEGGLGVLRSFIDSGLWDEARIITASKTLENGIPAPALAGTSIAKFMIHTDMTELLLNPNNVIYS